MRSSVIKLLRRGLSGFSLMEIILPVINLFIGLGIVNHSSKMIKIGIFLQTVLFFLFLEFGSQFFQFYKKEFLSLPRKSPERSATAMLVILFFGLSALPLSRIILDSISAPVFLTVIALSGFLTLIWRNAGEAPIMEVLSLFFFLLNNSFFLPLSQLVRYDLEVSSLFISISQVIFLSLLGFLLLREIIRIEIDLEESRIVESIGTLPLLRISVICLLLGGVLQILFTFRHLDIGLIAMSAISSVSLMMMIFQSNNLSQVGKPGLVHIFRWASLVLVVNYLGMGYFLWIN